MLLPLNTLINERYIPTRYITSGGMAEIYEARDTYCRKKVALKVIKEELSDDLFELDRFKNEARFVAMFSHNHIIKIFNVGKYKQNFFISYEFLDGKTLKDFLDERGKLSPTEAINYMLQILDATKHIHNRDVIHNDLKPDNISMFYDGNIKILDFGIATHIGEEIDQKANASIAYAAPEVLRNKQFSVQSDIYSLGIILFEFLTGRNPYSRNSTEEEIKAHIYDEIPSISQYINIKEHNDFDFIIKKATNRDLTKRYKKDEEIINDLQKIKNGEPVKKLTLFERLFKRK